MKLKVQSSRTDIKIISQWVNSVFTAMRDEIPRCRENIRDERILITILQSLPTNVCYCNSMKKYVTVLKTA